MKKVEDLTIEELEFLIEQKILEIFVDPDYGLELRDEFKEKLRQRLENSSPRIFHSSP